MAYGITNNNMIMYGYGCDDVEDATAVYTNNNLTVMYIIILII